MRELLSFSFKGSGVASVARTLAHAEATKDVNFLPIDLRKGTSRQCTFSRCCLGSKPSALSHLTAIGCAKFIAIGCSQLIAIWCAKFSNICWAQLSDAPSSHPCTSSKPSNVWSSQPSVGPSSQLSAIGCAKFIASYAPISQPSGRSNRMRQAHIHVPAHFECVKLTAICWAKFSRRPASFSDRRRSAFSGRRRSASHSTLFPQMHCAPLNSMAVHLATHSSICSRNSGYGADQRTGHIMASWHMRSSCSPCSMTKYQPHFQLCYPCFQQYLSHALA